MTSACSPKTLYGVTSILESKDDRQTHSSSGANAAADPMMVASSPYCNYAQVHARDRRMI